MGSSAHNRMTLTGEALPLCGLRRMGVYGDTLNQRLSFFAKLNTFRKINCIISKKKENKKVVLKWDCLKSVWGQRLLACSPTFTLHPLEPLYFTAASVATPMLRSVPQTIVKHASARMYLDITFWTLCYLLSSHVNIQTVLQCRWRVWVLSLFHAHRFYLSQWARLGGVLPPSSPLDRGQ